MAVRWGAVSAALAVLGLIAIASAGISLNRRVELLNGIDESLAVSGQFFLRSLIGAIHAVES